MRRGPGSGSDRSDEYRINKQINSAKVRLISEGSDAVVVDLEEALEIARSKDLDLVEISPNQDPPIVKVIDYSKFKYDQLKKAKEAKKKQKVIQLKEIKMRPAIDSHDFDHKVRRALEFLHEGDKVKFTLMFRGREMAHTDLGFNVMRRAQEALGESIIIEKEPAQEGRNITMIVSYKKK
jgi:translation initiation factor IF-3